MTKKELNEQENRELNFHQDIKNSQFEMDIPVNKLIKKVIFNQFWGPKQLNFKYYNSLDALKFFNCFILWT